jgi:aspartate/methionine/tyrosine aminotransferase
MAECRPRFASRTGWDLEPNRLAALVESRRRAGLPILDLTESNPTSCGFEYDREAILAAWSDPRALHYEPQPRGLPAAREAVAEYYAARGVEVRPEQVLLTSGSSEAYAHLFRLLADPGDNVLVPHPGYPLLEFLSRLNDVELAAYRLEYHRGWEIDFDSLEATAGPRTRAVIVVHPNNPTGSLVKPQERERVAEFCARRNLALIADEVFLDYCLPGPEGAPGRASADTPLVMPTGIAPSTPADCSPSTQAGMPRSAPAGIPPSTPAGTPPRAPADTPRDTSAKTPGGAAAPPSGSFAAAGATLAFTLNGLSKTAALPQAKLGWIVAGGPPAAVDQAGARLEVIADSYLAVSTAVQWALPGLLACRHGIQRQILGRVTENLQRLDQRLAGQSLCRRLEVEAAWSVVLRVPSVRTDEEWALELLEQDGVLVHPGHFFDFAGEGYLVASLLPQAALFEEAMARLVARIGQVVGLRPAR